MEKLLDGYVIYFIMRLRDRVSDLAGNYIDDAQALSAIFLLLYVGVESYKLLLGDKKLEIGPLLRPFALGLLLMFWVQFINVLNDVGDAVSNKSRESFYTQLKIVQMKSDLRYKKLDSVAFKLQSISTDIERAESEHRSLLDKGLAVLGIDLEKIGNQLSGMYILVVNRIKRILHSIIEFIAISFWQMCTYLIFFLQLMFSTLLAILGPFSVALSILPAFRDAFTQWLARYISIMLYSVIAYIVLFLALQIVKISLDAELQVLSTVLNNPEKLIMYATFSNGATNYLIVACGIGAISMLTIPFVSTWVVQTSGVGRAVGAFAIGGIKAATAPISVAKKIGSKGML